MSTYEQTTAASSTRPGHTSGKQVCSQPEENEVDANFRRRVLDPQADLALFAQQVASGLHDSGLRVSVLMKDQTIEWTSLDGDRVTLRTRVSEPSAAVPTVEFEATAGGETFRWRISTSHEDAVAYRKFIRKGSRLHGTEIQKFVAALGGGGPVADQDDDEDFCIALGAGTGIVNPVGGFLLGAMCLWFASNGLD